MTDLAGVRRRRRNAGRLLLAAAAVLVGGVVVGQNVDGVGSDDDAADAGSVGSTVAEAPRDRADPVPGEVDDEAGGEQATQATGSDTAGDAAALLDSVQAPLRLTSDNFALDVQRQLGRPVSARRQAANADYDGVLAYAAKNGDFDCPDGAYGQGATLPAYYDAEEAVLVLRRPRAGIQRVELLTCGTAVELASVELSAP